MARPFSQLRESLPPYFYGKYAQIGQEIDLLAKNSQPLFPFLYTWTKLQVRESFGLSLSYN
jgi:hypothetical protein